MASAAGEKAQNYLGKLDQELSKIPAINNLEKQTGVPKSYAVIGVAALYFFLIIFNLGGQLLTNLAGFVIPAHYSLNALFTADKSDDTQWLTYWVVFAFFTVAESFINIVYWFPFYYVFKFILILWMALPVTNGAQIVFRSLLHPIFARFFQGQGPSTTTSGDVRNKADAAFKSQ